MCNNVLELVGNPDTVFPVTKLSPDLNYDPEEGMPWWIVARNWFRQRLYEAITWYNNIPSWCKAALGAILAIGYVALACISGGSSMGMGVALLGAKSAIMSTAAGLMLISLCVGVGFAVVSWAGQSLATNDWDTNALTAGVAESVMFTGLFMFVSSSVSYLKALSRDPYPTPKLEKMPETPKQSGIQEMSYNDMLPNERAAYDGYSKHGWKGNYPGQTKGINAGGKYKNVDDILPKGTYHKFDINPALTETGRDASRFVVSSDYVVYLTRNHYVTFFRIIK